MSGIVMLALASGFFLWMGFRCLAVASNPVEWFRAQYRGYGMNFDALVADPDRSNRTQATGWKAAAGLAFFFAAAFGLAAAYLFWTYESPAVKRARAEESQRIWRESIEDNHRRWEKESQKRWKKFGDENFGPGPLLPKDAANQEPRGEKQVE